MDDLAQLHATIRQQAELIARLQSLLLAIQAQVAKLLPFPPPAATLAQEERRFQREAPSKEPGAAPRLDRGEAARCIETMGTW